MVLVTGTWRMWLIGTIASLVMFGVVYVTVIKPDNSLARSCRLPGEAASRPSGSPQRPARH